MKVQLMQVVEDQLEGEEEGDEVGEKEGDLVPLLNVMFRL
jgi:hypothetical protein